MLNNTLHQALVKKHNILKVSADVPNCMITGSTKKTLMKTKHILTQPLEQWFYEHFCILKVSADVLNCLNLGCIKKTLMKTLNTHTAIGVMVQKPIKKFHM